MDFYFYFNYKVCQLHAVAQCGASWQLLAHSCYTALVVVSIDNCRWFMQNVLFMWC